MTYEKIEEAISSEFIASLDAGKFNETLDFFSSEPHCEVEIYDKIFDDYRDYIRSANTFDFNGALFEVVKDFAISHLEDENHDDIAEFIWDKVNVYWNYFVSGYEISDENLEELESMLHKEFPKDADGYDHEIFDSLYLCFVLDKIGIDRDNFPREEVEE